MPHLSIIIPTKNEEKNLPNLLDCIKAQTFKDYEIIIADAQSNDRTREIATSYGARVVDGGMPGPGRNRGAAVAQGQMLLFLDADVSLPSTKFLSENLEEMKRKGANVATCLVKAMSRNPIDKAMHEAYNAYAVATERVRPHAPGFCFFVKKHVHDELGGFDETVVFAEDHEYAQRIERSGYRFRILRSQPVGAAVRRLQKDGRLGISIKYMMAELHMMVKGPYRELPYEYEMGGEAYPKDEKDEGAKE